MVSARARAGDGGVGINGVGDPRSTAASPSPLRKADLDVAATPAPGVLPPRTADGDAAAARRLYNPPPSDALPLLAACFALGCWAIAMRHALFAVRLPTLSPPSSPSSSIGRPTSTTPATSPWWDVLLTFAAVEFTSTALFITAHDAMHGAVCRSRRWVNDLIGRLCLSLYAWFDYGLLHEKHWEVRRSGGRVGRGTHARRNALRPDDDNAPPPPRQKTTNNTKQHHNHTGRVGGDPDFHGGDPNFFKWFLRFMLTYSTLGQYARIAAWVFFLQALGAPYENVVLYVAAAPITAAVRLFYFGTYLPHLPPLVIDSKEEKNGKHQQQQQHMEEEEGWEEEGGENQRQQRPAALLRALPFLAPPRPRPLDGKTVMAWQLSHTADVPPLLAFLQCLCFGYHWEHHRFPYAPWFDLPKVRALARRHGLRRRCVQAYLAEAAAREVQEQQQLKQQKGA
jgi:hypothetical protein